MTGTAWEQLWRPSVAVDVALLTVVRHRREARLSVLLHRATDGPAAGRWALPGTFLKDHHDRLAAAALRALEVKAGVTGRTPRQLEVFDEPDRDDRWRVLSVAHVDLVPERDLVHGSEAVLAPVEPHSCNAVLPDGQEALPFDHDRIVRHAVRSVRRLYRGQVDPGGLLGPEFTLYELRRVHEAIAGRELQKDNFRRAVRDLVVPLGVLDPRGGTVGKPAELHRAATASEVRAARERRSSR